MEFTSSSKITMATNRTGICHDAVISTLGITSPFNGAKNLKVIYLTTCGFHLMVESFILVEVLFILLFYHRVEPEVKAFRKQTEPYLLYKPERHYCDQLVLRRIFNW